MWVCWKVDSVNDLHHQVRPNSIDFIRQSILIDRWYAQRIYEFPHHISISHILVLNVHFRESHSRSDEGGITQETNMILRMQSF